MTIKELKDLIKDLPNDMEIFKDVLNHEIEGNHWDYVVEPIVRPRVKRVGNMKEGAAVVAVAQRACKETKDAKKCLIL